MYTMRAKTWLNAGVVYKLPSSAVILSMSMLHRIAESDAADQQHALMHAYNSLLVSNTTDNRDPDGNRGIVVQLDRRTDA